MTCIMLVSTPLIVVQVDFDSWLPTEDVLKNVPTLESEQKSSIKLYKSSDSRTDYIRTRARCASSYTINIINTWPTGEKQAVYP